MTVYLDHNATAPLSRTARATWLRLQKESWHNPSAPYRPAARARALLEDYRERLARLTGLSDPARIVFTSGATESTNAVIAYLENRYARSSSPRAIAFPAGEHASMVESVSHLWSGPTAALPVDSSGVVRLDALADLLEHPGSRPALVAIIAANNETGVLQPWPQAADACRRAGVPFHCDAAQWLGRLDPGGLGQCAWLTGSSHKSGGPKGIGFLIRPADASGLLAAAGGGQERGQRSGTEDLPAIGAMVEHLEVISHTLATRRALSRGRDRFESILQASIPGLRILGADTTRLWNTSCILLPRHPQTRWINALEKADILAAAGSACSAAKASGEGSAAVRALGLDAGAAARVLRFSSGLQTTVLDWERAASGIVAALKKLDNSVSANVISLP